MMTYDDRRVVDAYSKLVSARNLVEDSVSIVGTEYGRLSCLPPVEGMDDLRSDMIRIGSELVDLVSSYNSWIESRMEDGIKT